MNNAKSKDIKFISLFILIVTLSFFYLFQTSYAKYRKMIDGNISSNIASWKIVVNDEIIGNKKTLTNDIVPVFPGDEYTKDSVLAPGSVGYFDLIIDANDVDVSFNYEIIPEVSDESIIKDLKVNSYIINPDENSANIPYNKEQAITGTIEHNSKNITIRVYIEWDDSEEATMDNTADTNAAINDDGKALITTSLKFSQIKN